MIKASGSLQDLRRRLYVKAKAEPRLGLWDNHKAGEADGE